GSWLSPFSVAEKLTAGGVETNPSEPAVNVAVALVACADPAKMPVSASVAPIAATIAEAIPIRARAVALNRVLVIQTVVIDAKELARTTNRWRPYRRLPGR